MNAPLPHCRLTMREIIAITAQHFEVSLPDMLSPRRDDRIVQPRHAAAYLIKALIPRSFPEIGRALGNRDHSTIMSAIRSAEIRLTRDPVFRDKVEAIHAYCQQAVSLAQPDVNPFEAAVQILSSPRAATSASVETIRDLAAIAMAALKEASRQANEAARDIGHGLDQAERAEDQAISAEVEQLRVALKAANDEIVRLNNRPAPLEAELRDFLAAEQRLGICSAAGERAARQHVERAKTALSLAFETHFNPRKSK